MSKCTILILLLAIAACGNSQQPEEQKMNVLFIAVDDLRPELGCYGNPLIKTPNIDKLGAKGTVFMRAYCQQAVCSPSRTSLMTGLRPDATKIYDLNTHFRTTIPNVVTVSQYFKQNGYYARAFGKIFHANLLDSLSWSEPNIIPQAVRYAKPENIELVKRKKEAVEGKIFKTAGARYNATAGPPYESTDVPDNTYSDGIVADMAIDLLKDEKMKRKPFFLAVGFYKPHLPFVAPSKYWKLYKEVEIPVASNPFYPVDMPDVAKTLWGELRAYYGIPQEGPLSEGMAKKLKHGYYASVSYTDAQIGRVLKELDKQDLSDNTIVVLWGDHGWKLGEHNMWSKHTNFEIDTRVPLICYTPKQDHKGNKTNAMVELIDIYPTLCELAGLDQPTHLQGKSFAPLLDNNDLQWKDAAYSQFPRRGGVMGYSMRTDHYRFTQWIDKNNKIVGTELYDHRSDSGENTNLAENNEVQAVVRDYSQRLEDYIKGSYK